MFLVALSIAMLLAAPLLAAALMRRPALAAGLDGFVLVAVGGVVALHVVPQSAELAGPLAIAFAALGLFLPVALHRLDDAVLARGAARRARDVALFVVFLAGLLVHALFDGAALADSARSGALALGVILHRVPVGLALWVVARPKLGTARTLVVVAVYAGGTVAGSIVGAELLAHASAPALAVFQAFVAGSILHIVAESPALPLPRARPTPFIMRAAPLRAPPPSTTVRAAGLVGSLVAVVVLWLTERAHAAHDDAHDAHDAHDHALTDGVAGPHFVDALVDIALVCAPAALLSFVVVGVLYALLPDASPLRRARASRRRSGPTAWLDAVRGAAAGLPHPLCSCAVAPLYDELVDDDAPPAAARAFLVAAPALGVPAVFLSARLLGLPFTALRVAGAALLAIAAGWSALLARASSRAPAVAPADPGDPAAPAEARPPIAARLMHGLRHGVVDAVDHVGPWLLVGVAVAAVVRAHVAPDALAQVSSSTQVGVAALASLPLYLCAAGITPIAFALLGKGASTGAVLAFLLVGPTTSLPTFALVKRHHGTGAALALAVVIALAAALLGLAVDAFMPALPLASVEVAAGQGPVTIVQMASLALLGVLLGASFVRQGVRGFLVQVMSPQHSHAGDDAHGPHCDHDHGPALAPPPVVRIAVPFDPRGPQ